MLLYEVHQYKGKPVVRASCTVWSIDSPVETRPGHRRPCGALSQIWPFSSQDVGDNSLIFFDLFIIVCQVDALK